MLFRGLEEALSTKPTPLPLRRIFGCEEEEESTASALLSRVGPLELRRIRLDEDVDDSFTWERLDRELVRRELEPPGAVVLLLDSLDDGSLDGLVLDLLLILLLVAVELCSEGWSEP